MTPTPTSGAADLRTALVEACRAINSMKVEAETAAQGDEQMMLEACETISNEGLQADMAIRAALASAPAQAISAEPAGAGYAELPTKPWPFDNRAQSVMMGGYSEKELRDFADRTHALRIASHGQAPAQPAGPCAICGSDEPFTGTCGSGDPRALCKQPSTSPQAAQQAHAGAVPDEQMIAEYGIKASRMMARDLTRFDAACEVDKYLREQGAPGYYRHRMSIILFGNVEGTEASRAPENAAPAAPSTPASPTIEGESNG